jgi:putative transposase
METYKRFFVNGSGFPKFKSKHDNKHSCRFPGEAVSKRNNYLENRITLTSEIKNIKFKCSDKYKGILERNKNNIKSATLSKSCSNNYFLSILIESDEIKILPKATNDIIGIDLGVKDFVIDSNGVKYSNLKSINNNQKRISKLQRSMSRKQKGSNNRNKERIKLAKFHEKLTNIKENYLHEVSNKLINENQVIVMENLNVKGMLKNHRLAKSIQELSLNRFKTMLTYKTEWTGRILIEIDRYFPSSKLCNCCGYKYKGLKLSERTWFCPNCGVTHDRDLNAAINIRNEGKRILTSSVTSNKEKKIGHRLSELTLVDNPTMDDKGVIPLKSSDWKKQEDEDLCNFVQV